MTRDKSHMEQVEKWADFVRENPTKWKKPHTEFINSIFQKHDDFVKRLSEMPNGREKIMDIFDIKNKNALNKKM